jgi:hypothetical protein
MPQGMPKIGIPCLLHIKESPGRKSGAIFFNIYGKRLALGAAFFSS